VLVARLKRSYNDKHPDSWSGCCRFPRDANPIGTGHQESGHSFRPLNMKVANTLEPRNSCPWASAQDTGNGVSAVVSFNTPEKVVTGPQTILDKRAKRVFYGKGLARMLVNAARGPLMGRAYQRTLFKCNTLVLQEDGRLTTWRCGYRWCASCSAIKTARAWNSYGSEVQSWATEGKCYLVTLTAPNCSFGNLRNVVRKMHSDFASLTNTLQKRLGKDAVKLIRATEVTHNEETNKAHPHLHLLVLGYDVAKQVVQLWMKRNPEASILAQDIRKGDKNSIGEVFKYVQKLSSDKRDENGQRKLVPPQILDLIFTSLRGLKLWAAAGIKAANGDEKAIDDTAEIETDKGTVATTRKDERILWEWSQKFGTWVDYNTGDTLTSWEPGRTSRHLLGMMDSLSEEMENGRGVKDWGPSKKPVTGDVLLLGD